jgi:hypothetical protein
MILNPIWLSFARISALMAKLSFGNKLSCRYLPSQAIYLSLLFPTTLSHFMKIKRV